MADIEPPSFSLGLDLDAEPEPQILTRQHQLPTLNPVPGILLDHHDEEDFGPRVVDSGEKNFALQVMDSDPESGPDSPRIFKRLRRGPAIEESRVKKKQKGTVFCDNGDDDIEEFSSQEDFVRDAHPSTQHNSVRSSSKVPLHGFGVLTTQSSSQLKKKKSEQASDAPSSSSLGAGCNRLIFPKLTISPLRRFQLIDSDDEEPPVSKDVSRKTPRTDSSLKEQQPTTCEQMRNPLSEKHQSEDLWKDFCPIKSFHVPTPVLDEVCEEYFQSLRNKNAAQILRGDLSKGASVGCHIDTNSITSFKHHWSSAGPLPPAHHYFFHDDPRIQTLVRCRLPNFSPLGVVNRGNQQPSESVINYMSQFNGEASEQGATQRNNKEKGSTRGINKSKKSNAKSKKSNAKEVAYASQGWVDPKSSCAGSTRGRKKSKKSNAKEVTHASQGWVDPKSSGAIPKDAGKRRVHANGQVAGHWYTSPEGKKVYVSRSGQELTGQIAYRHYKKDSGGFRKSKKKTNVKRKKG